MTNDSFGSSDRPVAANGRRRRRHMLGWALATALLCAGLLAGAPEAFATGTIEGTVIEAASPKALAGVEVYAYPVLPTENSFSAVTNSEGKYKITVPAGEYRVKFSEPFRSGENFAPQYFLDVTEESKASVIKIAEGQTEHEINAELHEGGTIEGEVHGESGGPPLNHAEVDVYKQVTGEEEFYSGAATVGAGGKYKVVGLPAGEYTVSFTPDSGENFVSQYWNDTIFSNSAQAVKVKLGEPTPNIDATLAVGGQITGVVTDASTHKAVSGIEVDAYGPNGSEEGARAYTYTNANGEYTLSGLPSGSYTIEYSDILAEAILGEPSVYLTQFYNGKTTATAANPVAVSQKGVTTGIDVALVPRVPVNTVPPTASGTPAVGQQLACSRGTWTGQLTMYFTYQWLRDGSAISGATGNSYVVQSGDQGHALSCQVNARNARGHASATSNSLSVPAAVVPPPPPPPPPPAKPSVVVLAHISNLTATRGLLHVTLSCQQTACAGTVEVVERVVVKIRVGHRRITRRRTLVLAAGAYSLAAGHSAKVLLRLTALGRRTLLRARHHRVAAAIVVSVRGGKSIGEAVPLSLRR
jgi:hypothetical protein